MNKKLYWIIGASLCLLICGCGNSNINEEDQIKVKEQEDVLLGQWKKNVSDAIVLLTFEKNGRVIYDICIKKQGKRCVRQRRHLLDNMNCKTIY